jgi:excisionase family DNA binding protein
MKSENTDIERATANVDEAAKRLGISRNSAYAAVKAGDIPTIKIGGRFLVPRAWLDRVLAAK